MEGVTATVNYSTEKASVAFGPSVTHERPDRADRGDRLLGPRAGACAAVHGGERSRAGGPHARSGSASSSRSPWRRRSSRWRWFRRCSSTHGSGCRSRWRPRSSRGGRGRSTRATWMNLRHAAATMDTLISVGVLAAFGWSLYALFLGDAGDPSLRHGLVAPGARHGVEPDLPRGCRWSDGLRPRRSLLRAGQAALRRGTAGAARARCEGRRRDPRRDRGADRHRPTRGRRPVRRQTG